MRRAAGWQLVPPRNKTESGEECNPKHTPPLPRAAQKSPSSWLYVIGTNFDGKLKRLLSPFLAGEEWVDHAPSRAGRMRWPHISAATKRARYSGALVRACVRNGKAIFLCVVLRFQLGLFSSVTFFLRVFPTMRAAFSWQICCNRNKHFIKCIGKSSHLLPLPPTCTFSVPLAFVFSQRFTHMCG